MLAEELRQIDWSGVGAYKDHGHMHTYQRKYYNHPAVPIDSGFVAVLAYMRYRKYIDITSTMQE